MIKRANILTNSFWYGIEVASDAVIGAAMSIAAARILGPEKIGYFVFLTFLTTVASRLGAMGVAEAARKYISEFLTNGQPGLARSVFFTTLRIQTLVATLLPAAGILFAWYFGDPSQFVTAALLIASIAPLLVNSIAALTNVAAENFSRNVPSAIAGLLVYTVIGVLTFVLGWGTVGLAAAVLMRRVVETILRLVPAIRAMKRLPVVSTPPELGRRLVTYSGQALSVTLLMMIVWDRSEVIFLKQFSDIRQLAFYSVAFSLTEYLLMVPNVLGGAVGATLMAEISRGQKGAARLATDSVRYMSLLVVPMHAGMAAIAVSLVPLVYGSAYAPSISALAITSLLAIPKAFHWLPTTIHQAADKQALILRRLAFMGIVNIALDALLIPSFGANGAAIANGTAQSVAVFVMWRSALRVSPFEIPWKAIASISGSAAGMAAVVVLINALLPPILGVPLGVVIGGATYLIGLRLTGAIREEDAAMIHRLLMRLPGSVGAGVYKVVRMITTPSLNPVALSTVARHETTNAR